MNQFIVKKIINNLDKFDILHDYEDYECFEVIYNEEVTFLKSFISKQDITTFSINMAIMYVNQGLLYAKNKLSVAALDNFMIWFEVYKHESSKNILEYYDTVVQFSQRASNVFSWHLMHQIEIKQDAEFYELIKDVIGINDFCCYVTNVDGEDVDYAFVPKCFVEKHLSSLEK